MVCSSLLLTIPFIIYGLIIKGIDRLLSQKTKNRSVFISYIYNFYWIASLIVISIFVMGSLTTGPITIITDTIKNPIIKGWTIDYIFACLQTVLLFWAMGYYTNSQNRETLPFFLLYFSTLPVVFDSHKSKGVPITIGTKKWKMIFLSIFLCVIHLILWVPDIVAWATDHCWLDESFPYAIESLGGQLIVAIVTLYFLSIITYVWIECNSIIIGIIMTFIAINNISISVAILAIHLINKNIIN